jgi:hypothetical protein
MNVEKVLETRHGVVEVECPEDDRVCTWSGEAEDLVEVRRESFSRGIVEVDLGCPGCGAQVLPTMVDTDA